MKEDILREQESPEKKPENDQLSITGEDASPSVELKKAQAVSKVKIKAKTKEEKPPANNPEAQKETTKFNLKMDREEIHRIIFRCCVIENEYKPTPEFIVKLLGRQYIETKKELIA